MDSIKPPVVTSFKDYDMIPSRKRRQAIQALRFLLNREEAPWKRTWLSATIRLLEEAGTVMERTEEDRARCTCVHVAGDDPNCPVDGAQGRAP